MTDAQRRGPLAGVRVLDLGGIGPVPFAGLMLGDLGADVVRINRKGHAMPGPIMRGRRTIDLDLRDAPDRGKALQLLKCADAAMEAYRPGVMERLGLGPDVALAENPRLVYARATGWGRTGPMSTFPGHDINYVALSGTLSRIRRPPDVPMPPPGVIGDMGGGGMLLTIGVMAGIFEARASGRGQVVETSILEGAAMLMAIFWAGYFSGTGNMAQISTAAPFYEVYECSDGQWITVGAIEPQFFSALLRRLEIDPGEWGPQHERQNWPDQKKRLAALFRTRTRDEWCEILIGDDSCAAPVLDFEEAYAHPHNRAAGIFCEVDGLPQPAPSPRFSRTATTARPHVHLGSDVDVVLSEWSAS